MIQLVEKCIRDFKYSLDGKAFRDYYFSHPDYPSLYAVTETLDFFGIESIAAEATIGQFDDLPEKFMALHSTSTGDELVYVTRKGNDSIVYKNEKQVTHKETKKHFLEHWRGIVLIISANKQPVNKRHFKFQWLGALVLLIAGSLLFESWQQKLTLVSVIYSILSFFGLGLSILIVQESLGFGTQISEKICGIIQTEAGGCQTVLNSIGAKIYKDYTLSDLCLVFFVTVTLLCVFSTADLLYFIPISLFFIPIIVYSMYYQLVEIKKLCALCLAILGVLLSFIIVTLLNISEIDYPAILKSTAVFSILFGTIAFGWIYVKSFLLHYSGLKKFDNAHKRFRRNAAIFKAILNSTPQIDASRLKTLPKIEIGNPDAAAELRLFLSPTCWHCHNAFEDALKMLDKKEQHFKVSVYFNINGDNESNSYRIVPEIIIQKYLDEGSQAALKLLKDWHINKISLEEFNTKYAVPIAGQSKEILRSHFNWCKDSGLNYAPIRIFQDQIMPNEYTIEELRFFID